MGAALGPQTAVTELVAGRAAAARRRRPGPRSRRVRGTRHRRRRRRGGHASSSGFRGRAEPTWPAPSRPLRRCAAHAKPSARFECIWTPLTLFRGHCWTASRSGRRMVHGWLSRRGSLVAPRARPWYGSRPGTSSRRPPGWRRCCAPRATWPGGPSRGTAPASPRAGRRVGGRRPRPDREELEAAWQVAEGARLLDPAGPGQRADILAAGTRTRCSPCGMTRWA